MRVRTWGGRWTAARGAVRHRLAVRRVAEHSTAASSTDYAKGPAGTGRAFALQRTVMSSSHAPGDGWWAAQGRLVRFSATTACCYPVCRRPPDSGSAAPIGQGFQGGRTGVVNLGAGSGPPVAGRCGAQNLPCGVAARNWATARAIEQFVPIPVPLRVLRVPSTGSSAPRAYLSSHAFMIGM